MENRGQSESWFSPSTMWALGTGLRLASLVADVCTCWVILPAHITYFNLDHSLSILGYSFKEKTKTKKPRLRSYCLQTEWDWQPHYKWTDLPISSTPFPESEGTLPCLAKDWMSTTCWGVYLPGIWNGLLPQLLLFFNSSWRQCPGILDGSSCCPTLLLN